MHLVQAPRSSFCMWMGCSNRSILSCPTWTVCKLTEDFTVSFLWWLFIGSTFPSEEFFNVYTVIGWESLLALSKYVAFKGSNGSTSVRWLSTETHICSLHQTTLETWPDCGELGVVTPDGSVHINSLHFDRFWRLNPNNWIWGNSDSNSNDTDTFVLAH